VPRLRNSILTMTRDVWTEPQTGLRGRVLLTNLHAMDWGLRFLQRNW
jgi:hypothetical protein